MTSLRSKTIEILENYENMKPRNIVEYIYEYNNDDECHFLYNSLPKDFQKILDDSADEWIVEIQKQNDEVQKQIEEVQKKRDEVHQEIIECRNRTRISEKLNEEVLRRIELNRIEMQQLGII
jgi:peptidoglycan hydrolase CwlO-like protein